MKKIAIVLNDATVGGVETAFINMMNAFNCSDYKITLYTNLSGNSIINHIPKSIIVVDLDAFSPHSLFLQHIRECKVLSAVKDILCYLKNKISQKEFKKVERITKLRLLSEEQYDYAIAYKQTVAMANVLYSIKASKKCVWIHGALLNEDNVDLNYLRCFDYFDTIFCVSEAVKKKVDFLRAKSDGKTEVFHNLVDVQRILTLSNVFNPNYPQNKVIFCTVGRLGTGKGQIIIPEIAYLLKKDRVDFLWYVVGDGPEKDAIADAIKRNDVDRNVIMTGTKENPFPYIKYCSIYVQTSLLEGWGLTVQEAKVLQKPIIATRIPAFSEQIVHLETGYLVDGTLEGFYSGIKWMLENKQSCHEFSKRLSEDKGNALNEISKLYAFLEE